MKKIFGLLIILAGFVLAVEPIEGFRDMKFGDPIEKLGEYEIIPEKYNTIPNNNTVTHARKKNEKMLMGDVKLKQVDYYFKYNELGEVRIVFYAENNFMNLVQAFEEKYGEFEHAQKKYDTIYYLCTKAGYFHDGLPLCKSIKIYCCHNNDVNGKTGDITIRYNYISVGLKHADEQAAKIIKDL
jgi:hypothetical protein